MSDWQVGDLALALRDLWPTSNPMGVKKGRIYVVDYVSPPVPWAEGHNTPALTLRGVKHHNIYGGACANQFRKIKPDAEPCEEEFTVLIKRMKPAKVKQ